MSVEGALDIVSTYLMMNVMIVCVVGSDHLERVEGYTITTVVVDSLEGGECEEEHGLASRHECARLSDNRPDGIEDEAFNGMVVERAERVRNV